MTTEPPIPPALTPAEWSALDGHRGLLDAVDDACLVLQPMLENGYKRRHALAALSLHEQPFGFTAEELGALARCLPDEADSYEERMSPPAPVLDAAWRAVAKIRALLPPPP